MNSAGSRGSFAIIAVASIIDRPRPRQETGVPVQVQNYCTICVEN
jgi:hypothetical protein